MFGASSELASVMEFGFLMCQVLSLYRQYRYLLCQWWDVEFDFPLLGPVLHISYADDVTLVFDRHQVNHHLYADDKRIYINSVSLACRVLQRCISDISCGAHHVE